MSKRKKFYSSASLSRCFGIPPGDEGKINKLWRWWKERKHTLLLSPRSAKMNCSRPGSGNSFCNCSTAPKFPRDRLSCGHNPFNCQKCSKLQNAHLSVLGSAQEDAAKDPCPLNHHQLPRIIRSGILWENWILRNMYWLLHFIPQLSRGGLLPGVAMLHVNQWIQPLQSPAHESLPSHELQTAPQKRSRAIINHSAKKIVINNNS